MSTSTDASREVAVRSDYSSVRVQATDREPGRTAYLWATAEGKTTAEAYNPDHDGPMTAEKSCPVNPGPLEFVSSETPPTTKYLEVGLVHGEEPMKGLTTTSGRKGSAKASGQAALYTKAEDRGDKMMRVFVPRKEHIEQTIKFFVGCRPEKGKLWPKVVSADAVFFYPEIWAEAAVQDKANLKTRRKLLNDACRKHAALTTEYAPSNGILVVGEQSEKLKGPLAVTKDQVLASQLAVWFSELKKTKDIAFLENMINLVESDTPDLRFGRATSTAGFNAFVDFSNPLTDDDVQIFEAKLQATYPHMTPNVCLLKQIHKVLCKPDSESSNRARIGDRLQMSGLGFFLEMCHVDITIEDDGTCDQHQLKEEVLVALQRTAIHMHHIPIETFRMPLEEDRAMSDANPGVSSGDTTLIDDDHLEFLQRLQNLLENTHQSAAATLQGAYEEHGGLLKYQTMQELMSDVSSVIDTESFKLKIKQILVVNNARVRAQLQPIVDRLGDIAELLKTYRAYLPETK